MGDLKEASAILERKLAVTLRNVERNAVAGAFEMIAGRGLLG